MGIEFNVRRPKQGETCDICGYEFDRFQDKVYVIFGTSCCNADCANEAQARAEAQGRCVEDEGNFPKAPEADVLDSPKLNFGGHCEVCGASTRTEDNDGLELYVCKHVWAGLMTCGRWRKKPLPDGAGFEILGGLLDGLKIMRE